MKIEVTVDNVEPAWVKYVLQVEVEVPDDVIANNGEVESQAAVDPRVLDAMHEKLDAGEFDVFSGPDVEGTIEGLDQDFTVREVWEMGRANA